MMFILANLLSFTYQWEAKAALAELKKSGYGSFVEPHTSTSFKCKDRGTVEALEAYLRHKLYMGE